MQRTKESIRWKTHIPKASPKPHFSAQNPNFYTKKLGFAIAFTHGEPPFYGQVFRDGARLNLRHLDEPAIRPELQDKEHLLSASITVDDAKPLFLEFQAASVALHHTLKMEPWGARTFVVRDPDGHLILFAGQGQEPQDLA